MYCLLLLWEYNAVIFFSVLISRNTHIVNFLEELIEGGFFMICLLNLFIVIIIQVFRNAKIGLVVEEFTHLLITYVSILSIFLLKPGMSILFFASPIHILCSLGPSDVLLHLFGFLLIYYGLVVIYVLVNQNEDLKLECEDAGRK